MFYIMARLEEARTGPLRLNKSFCFYVLNNDPDFSNLKSKFKHGATQLVSLSTQLPILLKALAYIFFFAQKYISLNIIYSYSLCCYFSSIPIMLYLVISNQCYYVYILIDDIIVKIVAIKSF